MHDSILSYNKIQTPEDEKICALLASTFDTSLADAESKIWHAHPVWFLAGNPIVGYSKQKSGIKVMFWSGRDFGEKDLIPGTGKYKDASVTYTALDQIDLPFLKRCLEKSREIQWDYQHIVKRKGVLLRLP